MQGQKQFTDKEVTYFRLSERVPPHNLYRRLAELVDWRFLYEETKALYSHTGQPSLDPVVFFKLVLVGRLENLVSDRRLVEHCALRLDILYFLGYEIDEDLPWHSTISRTRQLYPTVIFEQLFDHVFAQCVAQGLVAGDTQAVDSAPVKANASLYRLCEKQPVEAVLPRLKLAGEPDREAPSRPSAAVLDTPAHVLRRVATRQAQHRTGHFGARRPRARLVSNKTHYSPTDPEARISIKLGKARALNYLCSLAVDTANGVISHVQADLADSRDSVHLPQLVTHLHQRLLAQGLPLQDRVADTNYSNGVNYALLEGRGITPWIPVFGQYKPTVAGFTYEAEADCFTCPAGKQLPFKGYDKQRDGGLLKLYRAANRDCRLCARKPSCAPKTQKRQITRTAYDPHYQRALIRQQSRQGQRMRLLRQSTVEPVFGSLLQHYGLRQVNTRGRASAHKAMLLAAMAYNLKKLLKHHPKQCLGLAVALPKPPSPPPTGLFQRGTRGDRLTNRLGRCLRHLAAESSATATMAFWTCRFPCHPLGGVLLNK
ncbi:transposase IS4 family protein [Hymenobacter roseosalivarius DSM 11622]|uniref:Transposase IS4 family protein n=1 Tax=Hymenobacter roseosalivarius DSM 11622 TaxID=645990 RepID=A0A1W1UG11_9BACT|nr:IS1182 family transposase [Hymenobacter roseosalivarius]SMB79962.1 transposase IS4 family protein [Hymenobacter roseosalivarius DSM 11622]